MKKVLGRASELEQTHEPALGAQGVGQRVLIQCCEEGLGRTVEHGFEPTCGLDGARFSVPLETGDNPQVCFHLSNQLADSDRLWIDREARAATSSSKSLNVSESGETLEDLEDVMHRDAIGLAHFPSRQRIGRSRSEGYERTERVVGMLRELHGGTFAEEGRTVTASSTKGRAAGAGRPWRRKDRREFGSNWRP